jgi:broad specificity phosphatase PhoE
VPPVTADGFYVEMRRSHFRVEAANMNEFKEVTQLVLIRHGRTALNAAGRFRGRQDVPLDDVGRAQVEALARRLKMSFNITRLLTSPLRRAVETADPIAKTFGLPTVIEPRLNDLDYGNWQGLTPEEAAAAYPKQYRQWERTPDRALLPGGGCLGWQIDIALRLVQEVAVDYPGETVGLVTHQMVCHGLICALLGIPLRRFRSVTQAPGAFSVFETWQPGWRVVTLNDTCHLDLAISNSGAQRNQGESRASGAAQVPY